MGQEKEIARFFDCCEKPRQRKANTRFSRKARSELIDGLGEQGIRGSTLLEVGCGPGDLTRQLVRLGASRAVGIDLTTETLDEARKQTNEDGLADRIEFRTGNGATDQLPPSDLVVLDKVICCYPDWGQLVDNTSAAAGKAYGFVIPRSDGWHGMFTRAFVAMGAFFLKFKKCGFKPFVHDYALIHQHLDSKGFKRTHMSRGPIWMAVVYSR